MIRKQGAEKHHCRVLSDTVDHYEFSYTTDVYAHAIDATPTLVGETVPLAIFSHASTIQAVARYLVDTRGHRISDAARLLGRDPKSLWTSHHQTGKLPPVSEDDLQIPISIFSAGRPPLGSLVLHLKGLGLRNAEIARRLGLDPRTTWTVAKREVRG